MSDDGAPVHCQGARSSRSTDKKTSLISTNTRINTPIMQRGIVLKPSRFSWISIELRLIVTSTFSAQGRKIEDGNLYSVGCVAACWHMYRLSLLTRYAMVSVAIFVGISCLYFFNMLYQFWNLWLSCGNCFSWHCVRNRHMLESFTLYVDHGSPKPLIFNDSVAYTTA